MFLRAGFLRDDSVTRGIQFALMWSVPYAVAATVLFWRYHNTDSIVPRVFAIASSAVALVAYVVVVMVLKRGACQRLRRCCCCW